MSLGFFRRLGSFWINDEAAGPSPGKLEPSVTLQTDKDVYMAGDFVTATIDIGNPDAPGTGLPLLLENLKFQIKGVEKLDPQWFPHQMSTPGIKHKRGENVFLDCASPSITPKVIISSGCTKTYMMQAELPTALPPSYPGTTVRYLYYIQSALHGRWLALENGSVNSDARKDIIKMEVQFPLQIWVTNKSSRLLEESQNYGFLPSTTIHIGICWKEKDGDSEWVRVNEVDGIEEGYDCCRDEISSVSSYNPSSGIVERTLGSSVSILSHVANHSYREGPASHRDQLCTSSYTAPAQLSATEVVHDSCTDVAQLESRVHFSNIPSHRHGRCLSAHSTNDNMGTPSTPGAMEFATSEGFGRGRSYNIRMDNQILLRFSPGNSDLAYYFGDKIGGTMTFFHEGARRCLEVSVSLETLEIVNQPSTSHLCKGAPTITKVQSDHFEVVADLLQTSFLFSLPMDGPMSFSTPHVSVRWILRFEFFTTPKNVDWRRYEHPLLIEGRERSEWIHPITVNASPLRTTRHKKPLFLGELWVQS